MAIPKYLNPKAYFRKIIKELIIKPLVGLKFMNYSYPYFHGPRERLFIKNPENVCLSNTIFNTRSGDIRIGEGVLLSHNCMILTGKHNYEAQDVHKIWGVNEHGRDIEVGDGTWVASGVIICGNVKIGKHCVIAAGSVVNKDIPDHSFAAGVPAKVIKTIEKE